VQRPWLVSRFIALSIFPLLAAATYFWDGYLARAGNVTTVARCRFRSRNKLLVSAALWFPLCRFTECRLDGLRLLGRDFAVRGFAIVPIVGGLHYEASETRQTKRGWGWQVGGCAVLLSLHIRVLRRVGAGGDLWAAGLRRWCRYR